VNILPAIDSPLSSTDVPVHDKATRCH
jgi:hypothetical protein